MYERQNLWGLFIRKTHKSLVVKDYNSLNPKLIFKCFLQVPEQQNVAQDLDMSKISPIFVASNQ